MSDTTFDFRPTVERLQVLARGSLKQNLPKAVRLWVILRSLYGDPGDPLRLQLKSQFAYCDWSKQFFTQTEEAHKGYDIPGVHDPKCPCAKTIPDWLFDSHLGVKAQEWQQAFSNLYGIEGKDLENFLFFGVVSQVEKNPQKQKRLPEGRLFGVTSKNLQYDFKALVEMGWLQLIKVPDNKGKKTKHEYSLVEKLPTVALESENTMMDTSTVIVRNSIANDLVDFLEDFGQEINGEQRLFLDLEYIVHRRFSQQIHVLRKQLKSIWSKIQVPPIKITYVSASNFQNYQDEGEEYVVYPVCLYYSHRAPYLFAFGQTPKDKTKIDWYDYRIDRIQKLQNLQWEDVNINGFTQSICQSKTPQAIEDYRNEAWGFDFYKPKQLMLLRFDRYFHSRYIEGTEREELFTKISYKLAYSLIEKAEIGLGPKKKLLNILSSRNAEDIYCRLDCRTGDNNIIMRLRAWGPKVEVFLPEKLRSQMAQDIANTWKLYQG